MTLERLMLDYRLSINTAGSGTGGSVAFTTAFANTNTGAHTLSTSQIPAHTHDAYQNTGTASFFSSGPGVMGYAYVATGSTGGGGSHTHPLTQPVNYLDVILCEKD